MPKAVTEIRSLARSHTRTALNVLVAVMRNTWGGNPAGACQEKPTHTSIVAGASRRKRSATTRARLN